MAKKLDDLLKDFEKKAENVVSSNRPLWEGDEVDNMYAVDIHIWRKPGMGNSLQTIAGNKLSIMTATSSYLETLVRKEVITLEDLEFMFKTVEEVLGGKNEKD